MYKLCKTEQAAKRQRQLENGLLNAMLHTRYEDISISELCDDLQIPRKSFYRYFSSKDGALFALIDHTIMDFQSTADDTSFRGSNALGDLEQYFIFWDNHRDFLKALQRSQLSGLLVERSTNIAMQERMMPRYLLALEPSAQRMALCFAVCGLYSMVLAWQEGGFRESALEMSQLATSLLTRPLVPGF